MVVQAGGAPPVPPRPSVPPIASRGQQAAASEVRPQLPSFAIPGLSSTAHPAEVLSVPTLSISSYLGSHALAMRLETVRPEPSPPASLRTRSSLSRGADASSSARAGFGVLVHGRPSPWIRTSGQLIP